MLKKSLAVLATLAASTLPAAAEEISISGGVDFVSAYVFRGFQLADEAIQPYVEIGKGGFYTGVWFSTPLDSREFFDNEVDIYAGYSFDISESLLGDVGFTRYIYTDSDGESDTTELYAGLAIAAPLDPSLYLYYDLDLEATTLEGAASHSYPVAENVSLDLGGTLGFIDADGDDFTYFIASAALSTSVADNADAYVSVSFGANSEDTFIDDSNDLFNNGDLTQLESSGFWFGVGFSASN
ncbi:TorF family putative porin [Parvularcula sp. IMCC14364]|uniref:TorF family putative porin n=1 Tax=Parvularcula sp. IMCC14364 TaxID=3067902 RepID=UPI0027403AEF|nr:TorF family putative porin [Parvularcula sp. IMCC14364]